jgi:hypothetical protein
MRMTSWIRAATAAICRYQARFRRSLHPPARTTGGSRLSTRRHRWRNAEAAEELYRAGVLPHDFASLLRLFNDARKVATYEGDEPELEVQSLEDLAANLDSRSDSCAEVVVGSGSAAGGRRARGSGWRGSAGPASMSTVW